MSPQFSRYYTYIRPITKNKFIRSYATTIFNLIAIAIFGVYAIRPTVVTIISLQKTINEQKNTLESVVQKRNDLAQGRANFDNLDSDVKATLQSLIPKEPDLPVISSLLGSLITQKEATISGVQFQPVDLDPRTNTPNKDATISELEFSFSIQGRYEQVMEILEALKRTQRLINIKNVTMNRLDNGGILVVVNAKGYFLKN